MSLFVGEMEDLSGTESDIEIAETDRITPPSSLPEQLQFAYEALQKASSHLLRGNYKAAIQFAADAVNDIAVCTDNHGYANY